MNMILQRVRSRNAETDKEDIPGLKKFIKNLKSKMGIVFGSTAVTLLVIFVLLQLAVLVALVALIVLQ